MNVKAYLPTVPGVVAEALAVLAGTVIAAYVISNFPRLRQFVISNSVVIRDQTSGGFINEG